MAHFAPVLKRTVASRKMLRAASVVPGGTWSLAHMYLRQAVEQHAALSLVEVSRVGHGTAPVGHEHGREEPAVVGGRLAALEARMEVEQVLGGNVAKELSNDAREVHQEHVDRALGGCGDRMGLEPQLVLLQHAEAEGVHILHASQREGQLGPARQLPGQQVG